MSNSIGLCLRYHKGALVSDDDSFSSAQEKPTGRRRDYVPSSDPGSRLPHMNIRLLSHSNKVLHLLPHLISHYKNAYECFKYDSFYQRLENHHRHRFHQFHTASSFSQETCSTLDLLSANDVEFLLIIAPIKGSYQLAQAAFKVADEFNIPLKVCVLWQEKATGSSKTALLPWRNFIDVVEAKTSPSLQSWWDLCQITDRGAILVRPDEHVAWHTKSEIKNNPRSELKKIFSAILRLDS